MRRRAVIGCVCAAATLLTAPSPHAQERVTASPSARGRSELVYFKGRAAPVRVVRGATAVMPARPPAAPALPVPGPSANCRVAPRGPCTKIEVVSFGDGRGETVRVIRGTVPEAAPRPVAQPFADGLLAPVAIIRGGANFGIGLFSPAIAGELDRIAFAVEGVESGHGTNPRMWRPEQNGPQGPMQVSAAAAVDAGGGDRFDERQNRLLGRAFLAHMYERYGNWPDALAAYNWGPGNLDGWIAAGRPEENLPLETARYIEMVLRDALLGRVRM